MDAAALPAPFCVSSECFTCSMSCRVQEIRRPFVLATVRVIQDDSDAPHQSNS